MNQTQENDKNDKKKEKEKIKGFVILAAIDKKTNAIGSSDTSGLPWNVPQDLAMFQKLTDGHVMIVGKTTWDQIVLQHINLKKQTEIFINRDIIVLTHDSVALNKKENEKNENLKKQKSLIYAGSFESALSYAYLIANAELGTNQFDFDFTHPKIKDNKKDMFKNQELFGINKNDNKNEKNDKENKNDKKEKRNKKVFVIGGLKVYEKAIDHPDLNEILLVELNFPENNDKFENVVGYPQILKTKGKMDLRFPDFKHVKLESPNLLAEFSIQWISFKKPAHQTNLFQQKIQVVSESYFNKLKEKEKDNVKEKDKVKEKEKEKENEKQEQLKLQETMNFIKTHKMSELFLLSYFLKDFQDNKVSKKHEFEQRKILEKLMISIGFINWPQLNKKIQDSIFAFIFSCAPTF